MLEITTRAQIYACIIEDNIDRLKDQLQYVNNFDFIPCLKLEILFGSTNIKNKTPLILVC